MKNQRWYDSFENSEIVFEQLRDLNEDTLNVLSQELIDVSISIKTNQKDKNYAPLSLGLNRVLGLYQSNKKRRWYDKARHLNQAMLAISTLPDYEVYNILEGLKLSLNQYKNKTV